MLLTEGFLGWLSRFKLIRLRRIGLATLPRYGWMSVRRDGWMDGYQYIYCLPSAGGRIRSQGNYCLPPAGVLHSQNKVINAPPTASHKGGGGQRSGLGGLHHSRFG